MLALGKTRSEHCFDLLVSGQCPCCRLFCSGHTSFLYYTLIQFLIYRYRRSALVSDYFASDTLALGRIRSPTARPCSRVHIFSVTYGLVRIRDMLALSVQSRDFFDLLISEQPLVADYFDWGHTSSAHYKVTPFLAIGLGAPPLFQIILQVIHSLWVE